MNGLRMDSLTGKNAMLAAALVAIVALCGAAVHAQSVAVPDPKEWAALSPLQQDMRRADIRRQLAQASPQERAAFRRDLRERLQGMSPQERQALTEKTRETWQHMSPEQREKFKEERREKFRGLPA